MLTLLALRGLVRLYNQPWPFVLIVSAQTSWGQNSRQSVVVLPLLLRW